MEFPEELQGELDPGDASVHQVVAADAGIAAKLGRFVCPDLLTLTEIQAAEHHLLILARVVKGQVEARHRLFCFGLLKRGHGEKSPQYKKRVKSRHGVTAEPNKLVSVWH